MRKKLLILPILSCFLLSSCEELLLKKVPIILQTDSKFVKQWVEDYKKEHSELLGMVEDKEWVNKYGVLNYFQGKYTA